MPKQEKQPSDATGMDTLIPSFGSNSFNGEMAESYARAGQTFFENAVSVNQEIMRFAGERIQKDVAVLQSMSGCATWQDAVALQSEFFQSATEAYQTEMKKLWERGTRTTSEATELFGGAATTTPGKTSCAGK